MTRVGINGFGRIGRLFLRIALHNPEIEVVAINSRASTESHKNLLMYDTMYGRFEGTVIINENNNLAVNNKEIKVFREDDPANIAWHEHNVDIVIDSTGKFRTKEACLPHLKPGVQTVIISAPGKDIDGTYVMGVNHEQFTKDQKVISCASCTTNCLAPVAKILDEQFGIEKGFMTTVHAYTTDQRILDNSHKKDPRRGRSAAQNIIPTTTGATKAVGIVLPRLQGRLDGLAIRVPTATGSLIDLTITTQKPTSVEQVNQTFVEAARTTMSGIIGATNEPIVSSDCIAATQSAIVDLLSTKVIGGNTVKVLAWYDNEYGYTCRLIELTEFVAKKNKE
jgi:glyceraldehyde 3-phosphate dehydrogenase